jgi:hypothetical protein
MIFDAGYEAGLNFLILTGGGAVTVAPVTLKPVTDMFLALLLRCLILQCQSVTVLSYSSNND